MSVIGNLRGNSLITVLSDEVLSDRGHLGKKIFSLRADRYGFGIL
jgi:hypothetical protein